MTEPKAEKRPVELVEHGHKRIDDYFWLNERENPEVLSYLSAENNYTEEMMRHTETLQEKLYREMIGRIKQQDESVPYKDNGYFYYTRYEHGKEYPIYCRKKENLSSEEEIMLNVNELAAGYKFFNLVGLNVSPDNKILAFGIDTTGRRNYDIVFKNLITGEMMPGRLPNTNGNAVWANDNKTVFYSVKDNALRPYKILKHVLGKECGTQIFHEEDDTYGVYVSKSKSDDYIFINSYANTSSECRFIKADSPDDEFKILEQRRKDHEYYVNHYDGKFYITTNDNAKNFRLMETLCEEPAMENWREVIPHRGDVLIEGIEIFKNYLVVRERSGGLMHLRIIKWSDNSEHYIGFNEDTYSLHVSANPEFDTDELRYVYTSLTTPNSTYDYNMAEKENKLLKREEVLGSFDPADYQSERIFAEASDGVKIPISLVYKKGMKKDGSNPLILNGYGSYGLSYDAYFYSVRLSLLDRGFIYAIAHVRGGQEFGRQWYEDGKLFKKKNTFTDFIACAELLIRSKYTNSGKLFAQGGSAGGLLMGAVANMSPDLFKGIIADVPFVDVMTTMLDDDIPLTTGEYDEWGNPHIKEYYDYILTYSPYDNVRPQAYPAMLVTTGLNDSQVQYWEPAKWVAKLRNTKTDENILLLHTNMSAGHGGASGRFERFKIIALEYAFMLDLIGITE